MLLINILYLDLLALIISLTINKIVFKIFFILNKIKL